jgi:hypothetical protein
MGIDMPLGADIQLEFRLAGLTPDTLSVTYEAVNSSGEDLYLFNQLYVTRRPDGWFDIDTNLVWINLEDGTAHITKRIPDVPDDLDVYAYMIPCASVLPPGQRIEETIKLALPLRAHNPYLTPSVGGQQGVATTIKFSLGYWKSSMPPRVPSNPVNTSLGTALFVNVTPYDQLLVTALPIMVAVPVVF